MMIVLTQIELLATRTLIIADMAGVDKNFGWNEFNDCCEDLLHWLIQLVRISREWDLLDAECQDRTLFLFSNHAMHACIFVCVESLLFVSRVIHQFNDQFRN